MKDKILWIVPSRNRPEKLERFIKSFLSCTSGKAELLIALDDDDHSCDHLIKKYSELIWEINSPINGSIVKILNDMAVKYSQKFKYIGFNEDDGFFKTPGYEEIFIEKLKELGENGLVYGNDILNHKGLIMFPVLDSSIVRRLGFLVPPALKCMYADNFWTDMAKHLETYHYFSDVIIQHLHYSADGKIKDETSNVIDSYKQIDKPIYKDYIRNHFLNDMKKLKG
jgi:glycosyltransferase involved in cell wall biosynthesis